MVRFSVSDSVSVSVRRLWVDGTFSVSRPDVVIVMPLLYLH